MSRGVSLEGVIGGGRLPVGTGVWGGGRRGRGLQSFCFFLFSPLFFFKLIEIILLNEKDKNDNLCSVISANCKVCSANSLTHFLYDTFK